MKLIIFGAQGAGKGTMAKKLSRDYNLKHLSTGDLIRIEIENKSDLGKKFKEKYEKGELISDELVVELMRKHLPSDNYILDGFPRTVNQVSLMDELKEVDNVIVLDVSVENSVSRIVSRAQCPRCGKIYGGAIMEKKKGFCDECNVTLERRSDDTEEVVKKRLAIYHKETKPVLDKFKEKIINIDGNKIPEEVYVEIKEKI
jgi:adenylate kinase